jgi:23S rRNA pseudouridine2605 synthase
MAEPQRIAKLLARAGVASRREIERMIEDRRISIDGVPIETPATIVRSLAGVTVDGKPVGEPDHARLFIYHKPTGVLTAATDPAGRKTIYDRMPAELPRVVPVGRLDLNTEGLLLLTTDGGLKRQLELPSTGLERTYRARCYGAVTQAQLESLSEGIEIEGIRYGSINANLERRTGANQWIELRLREGKNREVRRVLEYLGLEVNRLIRTAYGPFVLADLPTAHVVEVLQHDLVGFLKDLKADPGARAAVGTTMPPKMDARRTGEAPPRPASRATATPRPVRAAEGYGAARPARSAPGSVAARPVRVSPVGGRPGAASDRRPAKDGTDRAAPGRPGRGTPRDQPFPSGRVPNPRAVRALREEGARPARPAPRNAAPRPDRGVVVQQGRPVGDAADATRAAKPAKGKGWAKASRPTKKVGSGSGKRFPRSDRPMTAEREDYHFDGPRTPDATAKPSRGRPSPGNAGAGAGPAAGKPRAPRPPAGGAGPRPPRPDKRR